MIAMNNYPASSVVPITFTTYAGSTGASVTLTGLAVTDIEIYKGTSMTQRASDAGYTLLDTDGIDIDGVTGFHGFSIDLGDNTDAGFYAVGSFYTVVVSTVTVDGQTVTFIADRFRIAPAEGVTGYPKVDVHAFAGTAATAAAGIPDVKVASIAANAITAAAVAADQDSAAAAAVRTELATELGRIDAAVSTRLATAGYAAPLDAAGTRSAVGLAAANLDTQIGDLPTNAELAASQASADDATLAAIAALPTPLDAAGVRTAVGLASANLDTQLAALAAYLDTEVAAILAAVDTEVAAIKAKTDNLPAAPAATGDIPTANANADALLDRAAGVETGVTPRQALRGILAAALGKLSGAATTTVVIRDANDTKDRITATVDADGNRTAVTKDLT